MTFLQPALLLGLPAILLPIVIHLLNRLRYKSVPWAAMMFLVTAARSSTKHARLRHYLILLLRSLVILFLVLALSRPIAGGWLGHTLSGSPDTILIVLDRSASMETTDPRLQASKRAHALTRFVQAADAISGQARVVLIENVLNTPQEVAGIAALPALSLTGPTDTAADIPTLLAAALDYMSANDSGHTEIWLASDLQASNWRADDGTWAELADRLEAHPMDVSVRLLALTSDARKNTSLSIAGLKRQSVSGAPHLNLSVALQRTADSRESLPMTVTLNGARVAADRKLDANAALYSRLLPLPETQQADGWGYIEIPADDNIRDNVAYFVYDQDVQLHTAVVADSREAKRFLQLAAAPAPEWLPHSAETLLPSQIPALNVDALSLMVWQAGTGADDILGKVETFAKSGGAVLCFPPSEGGNSTSTRGPFGLSWLAPEPYPSEAPLRVGTWDERDGPLARSRDGVSLPVGQLTILQRQIPSDASLGVGGESSGSTEPWIQLASYSDGKPFLIKRSVGRGSVFVCTSLPHPDWSNLGEGVVLVPMVQRILLEGGSRLSEKGIEECGLWRPSDDGEPWAGVDHDGNFRWNAGVYALGTQRVALNRPSLEDDPELVPLDAVQDLFGGADLQVFEETLETAREDATSELWPLMLLLAMLCMIVESSLLLSDRVAKKKTRP